MRYFEKPREIDAFRIPAIPVDQSPILTIEGGYNVPDWFAKGLRRGYIVPMNREFTNWVYNIEIDEMTKTVAYDTDVVVREHGGKLTVIPQDIFDNRYAPLEEGPSEGTTEPALEKDMDEESNLVAHARRELELIGEEQDTVMGYLRVIQAFADMGHSGGSASVAIPLLNMLLQQKNLKPLTDDPAEWQHIAYDIPGLKRLWQNRRNGEAFSNDAGATYWLISEGGRDGGDSNTYHESEKVGK